MSNFTGFIDSLLHSLSDFLMTEPICWFVGIAVLFFIAGLVRYMIYGKEGR